MIRKAAVLVPVVLFLVLTGCTTPTHVGTGEMDSLRVPLDLRPGALHVTPDETYILCETSRGKNLVFGSGLDALRSQALTFRALDFSPDSKSALTIRDEEVLTVLLPDLRRDAATPKPSGAFTGRVNLHRLPDGSGFVAVSNDRNQPNVWRISGNPPVLGPSGSTTEPEQYRGSAVDAVTGELILTNDRNVLEIFDLAEMKTVARLELPFREADYDIAAAFGWAFIASRDGLVIPVEVATRSAAEPVVVGGRGHVNLALGKSGHVLGVAHQDQSSRKAPYPTTLKVFGVEMGNLIELGSAYFEAPGPIRNIVVVETSGKLVVSCDPDVLVWTWE
jgi:hypothetical protein